MSSFRSKQHKIDLNYISKTDLHGILNTMPFPIILTEMDKTVRYANAEALKLGGFDDLYGRKCSDTYCRLTICNCPTNAGEKIHSSEQLFYTKSGEKIPVLKQAQPVHINDELFFAQFFTDLSQQQKKEEELKDIIADKETARQKAENETNKFEQLFEGVSDAIIVHDLNGRIIKTNRQVCIKYGYTVDELKTMYLHDLIAPNLQLKTTNRLKQISISDKKQMVFESIHVTKTGQQFPVEVSTNAVDFDGNKVVFGIVRDISSQNKIKNELLEAKQIAESNEDELNTIFNKIPSTIVVFDQDTRILRINQKGTVKFDVSGNEAKNKRVGEVLNCANLQSEKSNCGFTGECPHCSLMKLINSTVKKGIEHNKKEVSLNLAENNKVAKHTVLFSTAILSRNGASRYIATIDDITDRKKMETELVTAKEKAEVSEKLKSAFLNNISHEIRTPLNGLLGFLDFFEDENISKEDRKLFIQTMRESGDRLINTVEDIVETSKLDSGIIDIKKEHVKLKNIAGELEKDVNQRYTKPGVDFDCILAPELLNCEVMTDESKLLRTLRNLLGNAFKFTNKGKVTFEISESENRIIFSVSDTGIGIDYKDINVIFEPFRQADLNLNRAFDGNGLGLTIAKKMIKILGSKLHVQSEKGKGSCFSFSLPKSENGATKTPTRKINDNSGSSSLSGKTILIAEDDETNYLFLKAVLQKENCILLHAQNGKEAVNLFQQNKNIDLIIMDLKMPVMNGIAATLKIKALDSSVPIIAHSAYVLNNEKEQSMAAGCIAYIPKPAKKDELLSVINRHILKH